MAELKTPGSPFKVSVSLASPVFGYALGQFAADFLESLDRGFLIRDRRPVMMPSAVEFPVRCLRPWPSFSS